MDDLEITSYLRSHRKSAGLSQRDLAKIIGYLTTAQVSKYERAEILPPLLVALAYEAVFRRPVAELFPGIYETVRKEIEEHLDKMETELQQLTAKGREAQITARMLEWLWERKNPDADTQN
jgi:transcriptional regulator with XRE-family HTH domain